MTKTVLLVDYDPTSIGAIRQSLATLEVRVVLATDGDAGEREFHRTLPDLTLIQDVIPKRRGVELCRDLKNTLSGAHRPVVLLVFARDGGRSARLASRCDDCIVKPFSDAILHAKVRKFLPGLPFSDVRHA
jgi:two-component system response regulator MprA